MISGSGLDLGYMFIADFCYRLVRGSLIIATFSAVGKGVAAYMRDGLYTSICGSVINATKKYNVNCSDL